MSSKSTSCTPLRSRETWKDQCPKEVELAVSQSGAAFIVQTSLTSPTEVAEHFVAPSDCLAEKMLYYVKLHLSGARDESRAPSPEAQIDACADGGWQ